jgi:hypothetical protein
MKMPLTDKDGEVRELTDTDVRRMRPMSEVLPTELQRTIEQARKEANGQHGQG